MPKNPKATRYIPQIQFDRVDFGHFDLGDFPDMGPYHFDLGDFGLGGFGRHHDDPWHEDRQFMDRGHGDSHNDRHEDDPDYPDDTHDDKWQHSDLGPPYIDTSHDDNGHDDQWQHSEVGPHDDNPRDHDDHSDNEHDDQHSDGGHDDSGGHSDGHDDGEFVGLPPGQFRRVLGRFESVINKIILQQQQTIEVTERQMADLAQKATTDRKSVV